MNKLVDIKGYEGLYSINKNGEIWGFPNHVHQGRFLKSSIGTEGYKTIGLYRNNKAKTLYIHRLLAIAFIPNPENKRCINHKNGKKHDNRISNLEWCTHSENSKHAYSTGLYEKPYIRKHAPTKGRRKPVYQICPKTNQVLAEFKSHKEAANHIRRKPEAIRLSITANGLSGGYKWKNKI